MTNLIKKLTKLAVIPILAGSLNGCKKYDIDGNKIIKAEFVSWELREIKPNGKEIVYFNDQVKITNGFFGCSERFYSYPSNVFLESQKRMKYLNHKIDSIEDVKKLNDLKLLQK